MNPSWFAIDKSNARYFWVIWHQDPEKRPDFSGYTRSKESAVEAVQAVLNDDFASAQQLKAGAASRWRGILDCKYCQSSNLKVIRNDRPHPGLYCEDCTRHNKWLSAEQVELFEQLQKQGAEITHTIPV